MAIEKQNAEADNEPFATADVVPNVTGEKPFKVIFKRGWTVLSAWNVNSISEGQQQIVRVLRGLGPKSVDCATAADS